MAVLDFLFQGQAPASTTTYGSSTSTLPAWYNDYTQGLISKANAIAANPYQTYTGQRLADTTQQQQQAWNKTGEVAQINPFTQALGTASNIQNTTAVPGIDAYKNPYESAVTANVGRQGAQNLAGALSGIADKYIAGGGFGGSRFGRSLGSTTRNALSDITGQQAGLRQQGFQTALGASQADLARQLDAAKAGSSIGQTAISSGLQQAGALEAAGQAQQQQDQRGLDLAYQDFVNQRDYPQQQVSFLNNIIRGLQVPTSTSTTSTGPASVYTPSPLSQIASAATGIAGLSKLGG